MLKRTIGSARSLSLLAQPAAAQGLVMVRDISFDMALVMAQIALNTAASSASRSASVWLTAVAMCW